jgi:phosphatidylglycerophosphatase A
MLLQQIPSLVLQALCIVLLLVVGVPLCTRAARHLGRKDPGSVVWDEIATVPITFFGVATDLVFNWKVIAAGFVLHRIFDISKCPPARQLERLPEGLGIMSDDIAAGVYSCIALHALLYFQLIPGIVYQ